MSAKAWDYFKLLLKFSFSFMIMGYMVYSGRLNLSIVQQGFSHVPLLLCSILLTFFSLGASLYRWGLLMKGQNIHFSPSQLLRYGMIGAFFNTTMPGAVSGDIIKTWYVVAEHKGQKKTPVLASVLLDRVLGVFGLVLVSVSPIIFNWETVWSVPRLSHLAWLILLLTAGVVVFFLYILCAGSGPIALLRKKMDVLQQFKPGKMFLDAYDAWMSYRNNPGILLKSILLSISVHIAVVTTVILCAHALGEDTLAIYQYFLLVPIGLLTTAIPIAPAGLGVGHAVFAWLFSLGGSSHGAEVFTMLVAIQIMLNLTGVFFYLRSPKVVPVEGEVV